MGKGENVVLWPMECLPLTVIIYLKIIIISQLLVCLPTLELETFKQQVCLRKIGYANALSLGTNRCKKLNCDNFEHHTLSKKKAVQIWQWLVITTTEWLLNLLNLRYIFGIWTKLEKLYLRIITKLIPPLQQDIGFLDRMDRNAAKLLIGIWMKKWCSSCLLECLTLFIRMHGCCIILTKMKVINHSFS